MFFGVDMQSNSNHKNLIFRHEKEKVKIHYDGFSFNNKRQLERYKDLKSLEQSGKIKDLHIKQDFQLSTLKALNGKPLRFFVDFVYYDMDKQEVVYEDVKKHMDEFAYCKRQLLEMFRNIKIKII